MHETGEDHGTKGEGWLLFAAIVLGVAGIMRVFDAIWAFRYHGVLPSNLEDAIFGHSLKTYGWVYLAVAAILILSALAVVMARSQISRWIGIFAAVRSWPSVRSGGCRTTRSGRSPTSPSASSSFTPLRPTERETKSQPRHAETSALLDPTFPGTHNEGRRAGTSSRTF